MDILIIHYNTPILTVATIRSVWKQHPDARITVFDNSDRLPFDKGSIDADKLPLLTVIDNTSGQVVDWEPWLSGFHDKMPCPENNYGSAKHCLSVDKCLDLFPKGVFLLDSDVLLKCSIAPLENAGMAFAGSVHINTNRYGLKIPRLCPWLCWLNTPMLQAHGIRYFNPDKMWKLHPLPNGAYDTGAWLYEAVRRACLPYRDTSISPYIEHLRSASWKDRRAVQSEWLNRYRSLWK